MDQFVSRLKHFHATLQCFKNGETQPALICSKLTLTIETLEQDVKLLKVKNKDARRSGVFIVNLDYISKLVLVFILLTLNM